MSCRDIIEKEFIMYCKEVDEILVKCICFNSRRKNFEWIKNGELDIYYDIKKEQLDIITDIIVQSDKIIKVIMLCYNSSFGKNKSSKFFSLIFNSSILHIKIDIDFFTDFIREDFICDDLFKSIADNKKLKEIKLLDENGYDDYDNYFMDIICENQNITSIEIQNENKNADVSTIQNFFVKLRKIVVTRKYSTEIIFTMCKTGEKYIIFKQFNEFFKNIDTEIKVDIKFKINGHYFWSIENITYPYGYMCINSIQHIYPLLFAHKVSFTDCTVCYKYKPKFYEFKNYDSDFIYSCD